MSLEMSLHMFQNEMLFYVALGTLKVDPMEAIETLKGMGYKPSLKWYHWQRDGKPITEVCALIHRGIATEPEEDFSELQTQWNKVAEVFGSESVHLVWGSDD